MKTTRLLVIYVCFFIVENTGRLNGSRCRRRQSGSRPVRSTARIPPLGKSRQPNVNTATSGTSVWGWSGKQTH